MLNYRGMPSGNSSLRAKLDGPHKAGHDGGGVGFFLRGTVL
jgi:hypothetical protein